MKTYVKVVYITTLSILTKLTYKVVNLTYVNEGKNAKKITLKRRTFSTYLAHFSTDPFIGQICKVVAVGAPYLNLV